MNYYDNEMWDDFNHYMHTGELSEYFEEEEEEEVNEEVDEYSENDTDTQE